jgi:hypothetical protein
MNFTLINSPSSKKGEAQKHKTRPGEERASKKHERKVDDEHQQQQNKNCLLVNRSFYAQTWLWPLFFCLFLASLPSPHRPFSPYMSAAPENIFFHPNKAFS